MPSKNAPMATRAPAANTPASARMPGSGDLPRVDDHLVRPETREEMIRGRVIQALPALEPHGDAHGELAFAVRGHIRPGYIVSADLLTRVGPGSDFATDTSVRKQGVDPRTGSRHLEELAFEVVHTQSQRDITERAEDLSARGVRRVFAIFVKRREVAEWSPEKGGWEPLGLDEAIEDRCLVGALPIRALLEGAENDDAVARALLAKENRVLEQARERARRDGLAEGRRDGLAEGRRDGLAEGRRDGLADGLRRGVAGLCQVLGVELTAGRRAAMERMDAAALEQLTEHLARERRWPG